MSSPHPLTRPSWAAFALILLAVPLAMMVWPEPPPPLPHLARLPAFEGAALHGPHTGLPTSGAVVDITAWPCAQPCIDRTAAMAALAHGPQPPPLLSVFTSPPDAHPALDAAQAVSGWSAVQVDRSGALEQAWYAAGEGREVAGGGLLLVDHTGSVRGIFPATPDGVDATRAAWQHLQSTDPG